MIRHVVLLTFRSDISADDIDLLLGAIYALQDQIPGIIAVSGGENVSLEDLDQGFSHGFMLDFIDEAARDHYLSHPAHMEAGEELLAAAENGSEGILVFDYAL